MSQAPLAPVYFSSLLPELATRAARATVSRLGFSNSALRQYLTERFSVDLGEPGCFVGEPVFEATFGWKTADKTLASLSPHLLSPGLLEALDSPSGTYQGQLNAYANAIAEAAGKNVVEQWLLFPVAGGAIRCV